MLKSWMTLAAGALALSCSTAHAIQNLSGIWYAEIGAVTDPEFQRFLVVLNHDQPTGIIVGSTLNREIAETLSFNINDQAPSLKIVESMLHLKRTYRFEILGATATTLETQVTVTDEAGRVLRGPNSVEFANFTDQNPTVHHWRYQIEPNSAFASFEGMYGFASLDWGPTLPMYQGHTIPRFAEPVYGIQACFPVGCEARLTDYSYTILNPNPPQNPSVVTTFRFRKVGGTQEVPILPGTELSEFTATHSNPTEGTVTTATPYTGWVGSRVNMNHTGSTTAWEASHVVDLLLRTAVAFKTTTTGSLGPSGSFKLFSATYLNDGSCYDDTPFALVCGSQFCPGRRLKDRFDTALQTYGNLDVMISGVRRIRTDYADLRYKGVPIPNSNQVVRAAGYSKARERLLPNVEWSQVTYKFPDFVTVDRFEFGLNETLFWVEREPNFAAVLPYQFAGNGECSAFKLGRNFFGAQSDLPAPPSMEPLYLKSSGAEHREGGRGWNIALATSSTPLRAMGTGTIERLSQGGSTGDAELALRHRPGLSSSYFVTPLSPQPPLETLIAQGQQVGTSQFTTPLNESKTAVHNEGVAVCPIPYFDKQNQVNAHREMFRGVDLKDRLTEPYACNVSYSKYPMSRRYTLDAGATPLVFKSKQVGAIEFLRNRMNPSGPQLADYPVRLFTPSGLAIGTATFNYIVQGTHLDGSGQVVPFQQMEISSSGDSSKLCAQVGIDVDVEKDLQWFSYTQRWMETKAHVRIRWNEIASGVSCAGNFPADYDGATYTSAFNPANVPDPVMPMR